MPTQIIPIEGIDKLGLIADQPAVNIPPGAWSDVSNVRFDDGAIRKIKGHIEIFEDLLLSTIETFDGDGTETVFTITNTGEVSEIVVVVDDVVLTLDTDYTVSDKEITFTTAPSSNTDNVVVTFNTDDISISNIQHITYWENPNTRYYIVINRDTSASTDTVYTLELESTGEAILVERGDFDTPTTGQRDSWQSVQFNGGFSIVINNGLVAPQHITSQVGTDLVNTDVFAALTNWQSYTPTGLAAVTSVTANIIIAEGNVLLAGGLVERDTNGDLVRNLNSVVRVSDVAAPGTIPDNWNPFDTTGTAMRSSSLTLV